MIIRSQSLLLSSNFVENGSESQFTCVLAYSIKGTASPYEIMRAAGEFPSFVMVHVTC
jgi:hypothetical protein